jgi:hypothetical protein
MVKPIGLAFTLRTGAAATTGNIIVILRHEPLKALMELHRVQSLMLVEQQMHKSHTQFKLNNNLLTVVLSISAIKSSAFFFF